MDLFEEIKANLPLFAYPTKGLCEAKNNDLKLDHRKMLKITDVHDSGAISGIMCAIPVNGTVLAVALTFLEFKGKDELTKKIKDYQRNRLMLLGFDT